MNEVLPKVEVIKGHPRTKWDSRNGSLSRRFWFAGSDGSVMLCLPQGGRPSPKECFKERYQIARVDGTYTVKEISLGCLQ
jgi:hypothetical protein